MYLLTEGTPADVALNTIRDVPIWDRWRPRCSSRPFLGADVQAARLFCASERSAVKDNECRQGFWKSAPSFEGRIGLVSSSTVQVETLCLDEEAIQAIGADQFVPRSTSD